MNTNARLAPRGGTIFWGTLLLLIATVAGIAAVFGTWDWTATVWIAITFGGLMVVGGLVGGIARAATRSTALQPAPETSSTPAAPLGSPTD